MERSPLAVESKIPNKIPGNSQLKRLGYRSQFICGEITNAQETEAYLRPLLPNADLTFLCTGFRNHNDSWILPPSPAREKAREWLRRITSSR